MTTRRIGAAWEAAQNSVDSAQAETVVTLMVRFERDRQKLSRPMQLLVAGGTGGSRVEVRREIVVCELAVVAGGREVRHAAGRRHRVDRLADEALLEEGLTEVADIVGDNPGARRRE